MTRKSSSGPSHAASKKKSLRQKKAATAKPLKTYVWLEKLDRLFQFVAFSMALAGGAIFAVLAVLTTLSVALRFFGGRPIAGDFELVELGTAAGVFLCLPYCHLEKGHVAIEIFTARFPRAWHKMLEGVGHILMSSLGFLLAWRLGLGGVAFYQSGETSMILGVARWWVFLPIVLACAVLGLVALRLAWQTFTRPDKSAAGKFHLAKSPISRRKAKP